jgi:hypothetical protein
MKRLLAIEERIFESSVALYLWHALGIRPHGVSMKKRQVTCTKRPDYNHLSETGRSKVASIDN